MSYLTEELKQEWFSEPFSTTNWPVVSCCQGCMALVPYALEALEKHWRFHVQVTGNVHR